MLIEMLGDIEGAFVDDLDTVAEITQAPKDLIVQHARYQSSVEETLAGLDHNVLREEAGEMILDRVIGMATAIMLFVVVEEMLRDAHHEGNSDSPLIRFAFFGGFLLTLFIE